MVMGMSKAPVVLFKVAWAMSMGPSSVDKLTLMRVVLLRTGCEVNSIKHITEDAGGVAHERPILADGEVPVDVGHNSNTAKAC